MNDLRQFDDSNDDDTGDIMPVSRRFLAKLYDRIKAGDSLNDAIKYARGHAGGKAAAKKRREAKQATDGVTYLPDPFDTNIAQTILDEMPSVIIEDDPYNEPFGGSMYDGPKMPKVDARVQYRDATEIGTQCGSCRFYMGGCCTMVEGTIEPDDVCNLFMDRPQFAHVPTTTPDPDGDPPAEQAGYRLFVDAGAQTFAQPPEWIPLMPKPGKYSHPVYGAVDLPRERIERFVNNLNAQVYQDRIQIDAEHQSKLSGACGWITGARLNPDGSADARADWTDRGRKLIEADRFRYVSPEWLDKWTEPASETKHTDVLIGAAICTRPFFKHQHLRPLVATEDGGMRVAAPLALDTDGAPALSFVALERAADDAPDNVPDSTEGGSTVADQKPNDADNTGAATESTTQAPPANPPATVQMTEDQSRQFAEMQEQVKQFAAERDALRTQVDTLTKERRKDRFTLLVQGKGGETDGHQWFGDPAQHVSMMEFIADKAGEDSDEFKQYVAHNVATAATLHDSKLFTSVGTGRARGGGSGSQTFTDEADAAIKALVDGGMSQNDAMTQVFNEHPEWYSDSHKNIPKVALT